MLVRPVKRHRQGSVLVHGSPRRSGRVELLAAVALATGSCAVVLSEGGRAVAGTSAAPPRVTVIGDSVGTVLGEEDGARATLSKGVDLDLQLAPCRRVGGTSCPHEGTRSPTVIELIESPEVTLGSTVVVVVGYNDSEELYAEHLEQALDAFSKAGVRRVLWATLRAVRHPYLTMNDAIFAAAARRPELTVVDWNLHSRSHPDWFWEDGLHPNYAGAVALASLIHRTLVGLGIPLSPPAQPTGRRLVIVTRALPVAQAGRKYTAQVKARGGTTPYTFSLRSRASGLALSPSGLLTGIVARGAEALTLRVRVRDARGAEVTRAFVLSVRPQG